MAHKNDFKKNVGIAHLAWIALGLIVMLVSARLDAQVAGATVSGTVSDASGAVLPNAQVSIQNVETSVERTTTTDSAGFYSVPNLLPGSYRVKVSALGFSSAAQSGITLTVGAQQVINIAMKVGQASQTVEVTDLPPIVQLSSSAIAGVVDRATAF